MLRTLCLVLAIAVVCPLVTGVPAAGAASTHKCRGVGAWYQVRSTGSCTAARIILRRFQKKIGSGALDSTTDFTYLSRGWHCRMDQRSFVCSHATKGRVRAEFAWD